jgi:hypothetical protein
MNDLPFEDGICLYLSVAILSYIYKTMHNYATLANATNNGTMNILNETMHNKLTYPSMVQPLGEAFISFSIHPLQQIQASLITSQ